MPSKKTAARVLAGRLSKLSYASAEWSHACDSVRHYLESCQATLLQIANSPSCPVNTGEYNDLPGMLRADAAAIDGLLTDGWDDLDISSLIEDLDWLVKDPDLNTINWEWK